MSTELQRIADLTQAGISNTFAFIDHILIVTHGTEEEHMTKLKRSWREWMKRTFALNWKNAL